MLEFTKCKVSTSEGHMGIEVKERKPVTQNSPGYEFVVNFRDGRDLSVLSTKLKKMGLKTTTTTMSGGQNKKMYVQFPLDKAKPEPLHKDEVALRLGCKPEDVEEVHCLREQPMKGEYHQRKVA